jgi:hypothetical protein
MDHVRYTPMLKEYLEKVLPLAERLRQEDITKSRGRLDAEAKLMIEYMQIIQLINKYNDNEGPGATLWQWVAGLFNGIRKKLWGSAARVLAVFVLGAR